MIEMIKDLRVLLRDSPRRIWDDEELHQYLEQSLMLWNVYPPETSVTLEEVAERHPKWRAPLLAQAIVFGVFAVDLSWLPGGSLRITKEQCDKYRALRKASEVSFTEAAESKARYV